LPFSNNRNKVLPTNIYINIIWEILIEGRKEEEKMKEEIGKCIKQLAQIVGRIAKSLLNQLAINQFIAVIVLKEIVNPEMRGGKGEAEIMEEIGKCIKQLAQIVERIVKSLLNQVEINRFIVVIVLVKETVRVRVEVRVQENLINLIRSMMKLTLNWIKFYFFCRVALGLPKKSQ
jgi:urease gamma subunit